MARKVRSDVIREQECLRCNHKWGSILTDPKVCPKCKSPYWNTARKVKNTTVEKE